MSRPSFSRVLLLPAIAGAVLAAGCGSGAEQGTTENKIHSGSNFSKDQLNAPLSPAAKARGAQVPPPPVR